MNEEFKKMTDEELLAIVNLKTGHYTHDELQAAREEFINRMYREPLIPQREETPIQKEEIKAEPFFVEEKPASYVAPSFEEEVQEYLTKAEAEVLKEFTKEAFEAPEELTSPVSFDTIDLKAEPSFENLEQTRIFSPAEAIALEQKTDEEILGHEAEQIGFFEEEKTVFEEFVSNLTEEDYAFYERQKPISYCSTDTKLNKFCRRVVMPLVCTKTLITLLITVFAVISNHKSLTFNLYACTAFMFMIADVFAWDSLINDINPIVPKLVLSCELLLSLSNLFAGTYIVPAILVWIYIIVLVLGLWGLFPSKKV